MQNLFMSLIQRQLLWLAWGLFLVVATSGVVMGVGRRVWPLVYVFEVAVLIYAWVRLCAVIWKPLYHGEVSPGWCLALLFAFFGVALLVWLILAALCA